MRLHEDRSYLAPCEARRSRRLLRRESASSPLGRARAVDDGGETELRREGRLPRIHPSAARRFGAVAPTKAGEDISCAGVAGHHPGAGPGAAGVGQAGTVVASLVGIGAGGLAGNG